MSIVEFKSPETFFAILRTVKTNEENLKKVNAEIYAEFGPNPEDCIDFHASWLKQYSEQTAMQLFYWKEELYEQLNNN
jgi:hypothetical protein